MAKQKVSLQFFLSLTVSEFDRAIKQATKAVTKMSSSTSKVLKTVNKDYKDLTATSKKFKDSISQANSQAMGFKSTLLGLAGVVGGYSIFEKLASQAFSFNSTVEQSQIGIAALVRTFSNADMGESFVRAEEIQKRLQIAGLRTTATYEELLRALQEGVGPALRSGFDDEQIVKFTQSMTQAAAALSLPMDQLGQELRAIMDGTIDRNARIAKALQLDNETINEWKDAGTLFDNLDQKLSEFSSAGEQAAETFSGALSNLQDAIQMGLAKGTEGIFESTTQALLRMQGAIVSIDEAAGTFTFNEKIMDALSEVDVRVSAFIDSLTADDIANAMINIVDVLGVLVETFVSIGEVIANFVDLLGPMAPHVAAVAAQLFLLSTALKALSFAVVTPLKYLKSLGGLLDGLAATRTVVWMKSLTKSFSMAEIAAGGLTSTVGAFAGVAGSAIGGYKIGEFLYNQSDIAKKAGNRMALSFTWMGLKAKQMWAGLTGGDTEKIQSELEEAKNIYREMYDDIGKDAEETGKEQEKAQEKVVETTEKTAEEIETLTEKQLASMRKSYQKYADEVKKIQDDIAGREQSLSEKLRSMKRSGMSDLGSWKDRKKEAEEYEKAAKEAAEAGNFEKAVDLADKAKLAYEDLNKEVKAGDKVLISQSKSLKISMQGVERAGKLAIDILGEQEESIQNNMDALSSDAGLNDLTKGMDEVEQKWHDNWQSMRKEAVEEVDAVEDRIKQIKDKEVTIWVNEKVKRKEGGPVGFNRGGHLSGYGGGDRIKALLEAGEFVIRKEAVRKYGTSFFAALNSMRMPTPTLPKFATGGQVGAASGGAGVIFSPSITVNATGGTSRDADNIAKIVMQKLQTMHRRMS